MFKRILLFFLLVFGATMPCYSQEIYTGEAQFTISNFNGPLTAELSSYYGGPYYSIPETVEYDGNMYTVTSIGNFAFNFSGISELTVPNTVTSIGYYAFYYCTSLYYISLPNTITSIGANCFDSCYSLQTITLPSNLTSISWGLFFECSNLNSVIIPSTVTTIEPHSFYNCDSLTSIDIPEGVSTIGNYAISYCDNLNTVTIPSSVTSIEDYAFFFCPQLTNVNCYIESPLTIDSTVFEGINYANATLFVPFSSYNSYLTAPVWQNFGNIITDGCVTPLVFNVSGGGTTCSGVPGYAISLSDSQTNVSYILNRNNVYVTQMAGTGSQITFPPQVAAGTYTVTAQRAADCTQLMNGNAVIVAAAVSPMPTGSASQQFCEGTTAASLQATGTNLRWYEYLNSTSTLPTNHVLRTGTYYVTQQNLTCESERRAISVTLLPFAAAPTGLTTQVYTGTATLANLSLTGTAIKWYASASSTTVLPNSTPLVDGATYYATQTPGLCESFYRLPVKVKKVSENTQAFCNAATVSSLATTATAGATTNWFTSASGGTALAANTNLTSGTYYLQESYPAISETLGGSYTQPADVFAEPSGNILVANGTHPSLNRVTSSGSNLLAFSNISGPFSGISGFSDGKLLAISNTSLYLFYLSNNGSSVAAVLWGGNPINIAAQPDGKILYNSSSTIYRINTNGIDQVILATGLNNVSDIAVENDGKILFAEAGTNSIKRMNADGSNIVTVSNAFNQPRGVAVQADGRILISDTGNNALKRMNANGTNIETLLTGLNSPRGISIENNGAILVADRNNNAIKRYKEVTYSNRVPVTVTVESTPATPVGETAQIYSGSTTLGQLNASGTNVKWYNAATAGTELPNSTSVVDGTTYYAESSNGICASPTRLAVKVKNIGAPSQSFCNSATVNDLAATPASGTTVNWFNTATSTTALEYFESLSTGTYYIEQENPSVTSTLTTGFNAYGVAIQADGKIVVANRNGSQIRRFNPDGSGVEILGSGFGNPSGVAIQADGKIVITNSGDNTIKRMDADGSNIVTLATGFNNPTGIAIDASGNIWFCDTYNNAVKRMAANGTGITTVGSGFNNPRGIAIDSNGKILVGDNSSAKVKRMDSDGTNSVAVGSGFGYPFAIALRPNGKIIVADYGNLQVVQMDADGGNRKLIGSGIGYCAGAAVTTTDQIIVSDFVANSVKKIIPPVTSNRYPISVTVTPNSENTTTINTCEPYTWAHNNQTYNYSGTFYGTTTNCVTEKLVLNIGFPTVWDGTEWTGGLPDASRKAIIAGNYSEAANIHACTLDIVNEAVVVVPSGFDFVIDGKVTVEPGSSLTFQNNANLLQTKAVANEGEITSKRMAYMRRQDYVYWSSPVSNQNLLDFSPQTLTNRFYTFNENTGQFAAVDPIANDFIPGTGYMVRAPNTYLNPPAAPQAFQGSFTGVANNGNYSLTLTHDGNGYNFIGNPYPSPIDANELLQNVTGTVYFWTHTLQGVGVLNYASYNLFGGIASLAGGAIPNGIIQTGQGFLLKVTAPTTLNFSNDMRVGNNDGQFFRTANSEKHRIWLNLSSGETDLNQILVGYTAGATNELDAAFDGPLLSSGNSLSSYVNDTRLGIQARALPFETTDVVALNLQVDQAANFTLAIDHTDGVFAEGQNVYVKDNLLNQTHNLSETPYTFYAEAGAFTSRLELVFEAETLGIENPTNSGNSVLAYHSGDTVVVESAAEELNSIRIFDLRGREMYSSKQITGQKFSIPLPAGQQMILVQIQTTTGTSTTKKVMH
ncbi:leucine-rich repeat protein [Flavobacterium sp.]|uniref:leucine-rich repeat protein n=1 Tax=Flavobacterium sp. TaxID=239 RepID=UPI003B9CC9D0